MDRCALAYQYHKQGYNCAQSVAGAFADMTGMEPERLFAAPEDLAAAEAAATRSSAALSAAAFWCWARCSPIRGERIGRLSEKFTALPNNFANVSLKPLEILAAEICCAPAPASVSRHPQPSEWS